MAVWGPAEPEILAYLLLLEKYVQAANKLKNFFECNPHLKREKTNQPFSSIYGTSQKRVCGELLMTISF